MRIRSEKKEEEEEDEGEDDNDKDKDVVRCISAWVTRPERPKDAKDDVNMPEVQKAGPKGKKPD